METKRKRKTSIQQDELSQQIVKSIAEGVITLDMQGRIASCNPVMRRKLGVAGREMRGKKIWTVLKPIPRAKWLQVFQRIRETEKAIRWGDMQIRTNGHEEIVNLKTVPLIDPTGQFSGTINIFEHLTERMQAQEEIREAKRFFEILLRDIRDGVLVLKDHKIIWCNRRAEQLTGYSQRELLGSSSDLLFGSKKAHQESTESAYEMLSHRDHYDSEVRLRRKNGVEFDAAFSLSVMRRSEGRAVDIIAVGRDISSRKRAERERRERARRLTILNKVTAKISSSIELKEVLLFSAKSILKLSGLDGCSIVLYDKNSNTLQDYASIGLSDSFQRSLKWRMRPGGVTDWVVKNKKPLAISDTIKDPRSAGSRATKQAKVRSLAAVPILSKGKIIGLIFVNSFHSGELSSDVVSMISSIASQAAVAIENAKLYRQVTEKVTELSALYSVGKTLVSTLDLQHLLRQVIDVLHESLGYGKCSIALYDKEENEIRIGAARGIPEKRVKSLRIDVAGKGITAWVVRNGKPLYVPDVRRDSRFLSGLQGIRSELTVPLKRGSEVIGVLDIESDKLDAFGEQDIRVLSAVAAQVAMVIENARLFEEAKRAYEDLKAAQADVVQAGKMAAVGQLAAGIAHELNNPIGGILGYAQFALSKLDQASLNKDDGQMMTNLSRYLKFIEKESQRCKDIVQNLLNFSRTSPVAYHSIDLNRIVTQSLQFVEHGLSMNNVTVGKKLSKSLPAIVGNENQLQQVFINIILNAQKAMPKGGVLTVVTRRARGVEHSPERVEISFADTGMGIAREHIDRIFEPFFTTRKIGEGTGLGLSLSYEIVKKHGGEIQVDSQVKSGSTFIIRLPAGHNPLSG